MLAVSRNVYILSWQTTNHKAHGQSCVPILQLRCSVFCSLVQVLWLADNQISCITGLSHLVGLTELNLARNRIEVLGNSLEANTAVQSLNLADNWLGSFKQVNLSLCCCARTQ